MERRGILAPETREQTRARYEELQPTTQEVVRTAAKQMEFGTEEYQTRVTDDVLDSARDALFASLLTVWTGTREEFEQETDPLAGEREIIGHENVNNVAWHIVPFSEQVVAATFENQPDAAAEAVRRQAFATAYQEVLS